MATKRKTHKFRHGDIIDVEESHDGNYGAPGEARRKKEKPTKEQMQKVNAMNKTRKARHQLLEYFTPGDIFATWTYAVENRPPDMGEALADFQKAMRRVRTAFKKRERELFWMRNIEQGTRGAWHIHLVVNEIGDTASILKDAWRNGATWVCEIQNNPMVYDEDFTKLASYMTKDEHTTYEKKDGTQGKPKLKEASYSTSRNMPLPKPKVDKLVRWKKEVKPKKGYYIAAIHEGVNPVTNYRYRRYTMIRLASRPKGRTEKNERRRRE